MMHSNVLANLGKHPNVAAVLVIGLGSEVIGYGEIPIRKGVVLLDWPGYDMESMTGVAACSEAGINGGIRIFTTTITNIVKVMKGQIPESLVNCSFWNI